MSGMYRTDLAMEACGDGGGLPGVEINHWQTNGVDMTEVIIADDSAAESLGRPRGRYLTMECALLRRHDPDARLAMQGLLAEELARMLPELPEGTCALVVGLGNRRITPDALGPAVIDRTLVTRQMADLNVPLPGIQPVSAIAPGVLGVTGIETMDMVESVARLIRPGAVICVDALAARDSARIGATLQITDTGIQPGAGVGNHRRALTAQSIGAPVIAIGMPTVVYAATLARDAFARLREPEDADALADMEKALMHSEIGEMIVTPREIDTLITDAATVIAAAVNRALQPEMSDAEIAAMMD